VQTISNGPFRLPEPRFVLAAAVLAMAVGTGVLCRIDRSSRMQASADSVATPAALARREPSHVASPREYAAEGGAGDAAESLDISPASLVESLVSAQASMTPDERELVIADLLARLVEIDGQAAARFAELVTEPHLREVCLRVVAQRWTHVDAGATTSWAAALGDTRERNQAMLNVVLEVAQSDPRRAVLMLERQFMADVPAGVLEGVLQQWAERSYEDALAWSETLPPGARRDLVLQRLVFVRANQNPVDAARLAEEAFADSDKRVDALASIALSWGSRDLTSAQEWARTLEGHARERVDAELALLSRTEM
jgi:DNA-binding transcriptional regulator YbjK